jgi:choline dehydrogenase-like flavoprotein
MTKLGKVEACIIGSGAGGGVVAKELGERGVSVVVLEAGRRFNPLKDFSDTASNDWERAQDWSKFRVPAMGTYVRGSQKYPLTINQACGVGGMTLIYLGYVPRMLPDDFRIHALDGVGADWPITYEDLAPNYRRVELELGVSGQNGDPWGPPIEPYPNPPFEFSYYNKILKRGFDKLGIRLWPAPRAILSRPYDGRPACVGAGTCHLGCLTGARSSVDVTYIPKAEATGRVKVCPESVAIRIEVDARGKAKSVIYVDKDGVKHEQEAEVIIVSAGAVQSPRLLLASESLLFPDGLANSSGLVGKNLMEHLSVRSSALCPERLDSFRGILGGGAYSRDFAQTAPTNAFARGWKLDINNGDLPGPASMADLIPGWGAWHKDYMRKYFGHVAGISTAGEQLPDERNCVELDPEVVDAYGVPVPRITLEPRENDKLMLVAMEKQVREILEAAGTTEILRMHYRPGGTSHYAGTCRMGNNPATSVLNTFCQSQDVPNLFVVDGSCFVTVSTANPAHTIQAIATRAAEYIAEEGRKGNL